MNKGGGDPNYTLFPLQFYYQHVLYISRRRDKALQTASQGNDNKTAWNIFIMLFCVALSAKT